MLAGLATNVRPTLDGMYHINVLTLQQGWLNCNYKNAFWTNWMPTSKRNKGQSNKTTMKKFEKNLL